MRTGLSGWPRCWVLATGNPGKRVEFRQLLQPFGIELVAQHELGIDDAQEPHATFVENALAKARHAAGHSGMPALADDSGLCVAALGGAPGVHSARYAANSVPSGSARDVIDAANNRRLLAELAPHADRSAVFCCVLVLLRTAADPLPIIVQGEWAGTIASRPSGDGGFGYDPLFLPSDAPDDSADHPSSAAQLPAALKNTLSHRGRAVRLLGQRLRAEAERSQA